MTKGTSSLEAEFTTSVVNDENWSDLEALFEAPGGPKYCWCMAWRKRLKGVKIGGGADHNRSLKGLLHARVVLGIPIGLIGYMNKLPVGWVSVAPRTTYRKLTGQKEVGVAESSIWSVVCFFVARKFRGTGVSKHLLVAATEFARDSEASCIEAYPVERSSPSYKFMGIVDNFEQAGFERCGYEGTRRIRVRKMLK